VSASSLRKKWRGYTAHAKRIGRSVALRDRTEGCRHLSDVPDHSEAEVTGSELRKYGDWPVAHKTVARQVSGTCGCVALFRYGGEVTSEGSNSGQNGEGFSANLRS